VGAKNSGSVSNQERSKSIYFRQEIRREWKDLWDQKVEDKLIAEDIARKSYELLFVDAGTVIRASKNYSPLNLEEIMDRNEKIIGLRLTNPTPEEGGFRKFAKNVLSKQPRLNQNHARRQEPPEVKVKKGPAKKSGRGWLHNC
jgi:hypothetical protein